MIGFFTGLSLRTWLISGAIVAVVALLGGTYFAGRRSMNAEWEAATLQKSVEALRERAKTDAQVHSMPDNQLCALLGGKFVSDHCE